MKIINRLNYRHIHTTAKLSPKVISKKQLRSYLTKLIFSKKANEPIHYRNLISCEEPLRKVSVSIVVPIKSHSSEQVIRRSSNLRSQQKNVPSSPSPAGNFIFFEIKKNKLGLPCTTCFCAKLCTHKLIFLSGYGFRHQQAVFPPKPFKVCL